MAATQYRYAIQLAYTKYSQQEDVHITHNAPRQITFAFMFCKLFYQLSHVSLHLNNNRHQIMHHE